MVERDSIGLFGGWSGIHVGDDAILLETLRKIQEDIPEAKIQLFCSTPEITKNLVINTQKVEISPAFRCFTRETTNKLLSSKSFLERLYYRINWLIKSARLLDQCSKPIDKLNTTDDELLSFIKSLNRCKILIFSGGGYLNSDLRLSWLYPSLMLIEICRRLEIPVYLCGQTIGPLNSAKDKWLVSKIFKNVALIGTREDKSVEILKDLGIKESTIIREKDAAWNLQTHTLNFDLTDIFSQENSNLIGISIQDRGTYEKDFDKKLIQQIINRFPQSFLVFFPHVNTDVDYQKTILSEIQKTHQDIYQRAIIIPYDLLPNQNKTLMQKCKICIGSRFHFHVFALSTATPSISVFKQLKTSGIFRDYQITELCFNPQDFAEPIKNTIDIIEKVFYSSDNYQKLLRDCISNDNISTHIVLDKAIQNFRSSCQITS